MTAEIPLMLSENSPIDTHDPSVDTPAVPAPRTVDVLEVPIAVVDYERTVQWIDAAVRRQRVCTCVCATCTP